MADFPNTDNDKIDRKRLAENFVADSSFVSPQTQALSDTEQMLLAPQMRYLPMKGADPECDFFRLGERLLLVVTLAAETNRTFHCALILKDIFRYPALRALNTRTAQQSITDVTTSQDDWATVYSPEHRHQPFPLTDAQRVY